MRSAHPRELTATAWIALLCVVVSVGAPRAATPQDGSADRHLSVGGEIRIQYERYNGLRWGAAMDDRSGYLLQRYMLHGDLDLGAHARVFLQVKSGFENGRRGGPRPVDEDALDVHQTFLDLIVGDNRRQFTIRAGRQEIALGNSRLVTIREGANVRLSFDGVRALIRLDDINASVFAVRPVQTRTGVFDDATEDGRRLMGVHVQTPGVAAYFFDHRRKLARFDQGVGREHRYTVGIAVSKRSTVVVFDIDGILQRGSFGDATIEAWTIAGESLLAFPNSRLQPRLGLRLDVASGDRNANDGTLGTFHPLYPRGPEISWAPLIGTSNLIAVRPFVEVSPLKPLTVAVELSTLWRQSIGDGLYERNGDLLFASEGSTARRVGHELAVLVRWRFDPHTALIVSGSRFWAGPFLSDVTPGHDLGFVTALVEYRF